MGTCIVLRNADVDEISFPHPSGHEVQVRERFQNILLKRELFGIERKVQLGAVNRIDTPVDQPLGAGMLFPETGYQVSVPVHGAVPVEIPHRLQRKGDRSGERKGGKVDIEESVPVEDIYLIPFAL